MRNDESNGLRIVFRKWGRAADWSTRTFERTRIFFTSIRPARWAIFAEGTLNLYEHREKWIRSECLYKCTWKMNKNKQGPVGYDRLAGLCMHINIKILCAKSFWNWERKIHFMAWSKNETACNEGERRTMQANIVSVLGHQRRHRPNLFAEIHIFAMIGWRILQRAERFSPSSCAIFLFLFFFRLIF